MRLMKKAVRDVPHGPDTLLAACDDQDEALAESKLVIRPGGGEASAVDCGGIQTRLIQEAGRWVEDYACDLVAALCDLDPFLAPVSDGESHRWVIGAGMRASGVDGNEAILHRLKETRTGPYGFVHPEEKYRKILAVDIRDEKEGDGYVVRSMSLKDLTRVILRIDPNDE